MGKNKTGWFITAEIHEDHYLWVNHFIALHPVYGVVKGDFEQGVYASCEATLTQFLLDHSYECWDYWDI